MKKSSTLLLLIVGFLFVGMFMPSTYATSNVTLKLKVARSGETAQITSTDFSVPFGNTISMNLSDLLLTEDETAILVHNGEFVPLNTQLLMSGSLNLSIIVKDNETDYVAVFVDTNGEVVDVQFNPDSETVPVYAGTALSKPNYVFLGFETESISTDRIFIANYTLEPNSEVTVQIDNNDPVVYTYNERVTVSSTLENFTHWEDELGNVVSYKSTLVFSALEDIVLLQKNNGTSQPIVYMRDVTGIRQNHSSFYGYIEFDEAEYSLIEYGFLGGLTDGILLMDEIEYIPSSSIVNNEFLRSFTNSSVLYNTTAYATLKSNVDSSITTIYSNGFDEYSVMLNLDVPIGTEETIFLVGNFSSRFWDPNFAIEIVEDNDVYQINLRVLARIGDVLNYKILENSSFDFEANYVGIDNSDRVYTFTAQKEDNVSVIVSSWRGTVEIYLENYANWGGTFRIHVWGSNIVNPTDGSNWPNNLHILDMISSSPDKYKFVVKLFNSRDLDDINILFRQTGTENGQSQNLLYDSSIGNYYQLTGWNNGWVFVISQYPER